MVSEAQCCGGGLSGNSRLIIHFIFQFFKKKAQSNISPFSPNFKHPPPKFYTLKTFQKPSKNPQMIIELRTVT